MKFLSDVDGCVLGLMEGFSRWMWEELDEVLRVPDISLHSRSGDSPKLAELNQMLRLRFPGRFPGNEENPPIGMAFIEFMGIRDCYERYVQPIPGAIESMERISREYEPVFVTATMDKIPESYASKFHSLSEHFPGIPVISCPSELKQIVGIGAQYAIDDRWDICEKWGASSTGNRTIVAFCLRQPWNEAPVGAALYDWQDVADVVCRQPSQPRYHGEF